MDLPLIFNRLKQKKSKHLLAIFRSQKSSHIRFSEGMNTQWYIYTSYELHRFPFIQHLHVFVDSFHRFFFSLLLHSLYLYILVSWFRIHNESTRIVLRVYLNCALTQLKDRIYNVYFVKLFVLSQQASVLRANTNTVNTLLKSVKQTKRNQLVCRCHFTSFYLHFVGLSLYLRKPKWVSPKWQNSWFLFSGCTNAK